MKKLLIILAICHFTVNTGHAQWYSYDGFKKHAINASQTFAIADKNFKSAGLISLDSVPKSLNSTSVSKFIKANESAYKGALNLKKADLIARISLLNNSIIAIDTADKAATDSAKNQIAANVKALVDLRDSLTNVPELNTTIHNKIAELQYLRKRLPGCRFFPVTSRLAAESYFDNTDTLLHESDEQGVFSFEYAYLNYLTDSKRLGFFLEPLSDYIGPLRLSLGLLLLAPATKDSATSSAPAQKFSRDSINNQKAFKDRFKSSGGNISLNMSYAFLQIHDRNNFFDLKSYASPRFCIDAPKEDTNIQRFAHHTQLGIETQVKIRTYKDVFNILLCHRYANIVGNSTFYDNMAFKGPDRKAFNFTTYTVGFIAKGSIAVYYTWYAGKSLVTNNMYNNNSLTANIQL